MVASFVVFLFFFFKQKTAYEMRISDWSSDVCSSDLAAVLVGNESILREPHAVQRGILFDSGPFEQFFDQFSRGLRNDVVRVISGTGRFFPCSFQGGPKGQIGRAHV